MMQRAAQPAFFAFLLALTACATNLDSAQIVEPIPHPEATPYPGGVIITNEVDEALARAAVNNTHVILVMGANWCHDSRGLAGWFETPRFAEMLSENFEVVYINVGMPQRGDGFNLHISERFGIEEFGGTPTVLVLSAEGALLNPETASTWRDAASRTENEIFTYFAAFEPEA